MVYLDDLLVHAKDFELALENLRQFFQAIRGCAYTPKSATCCSVRPGTWAM